MIEIRTPRDVLSIIRRRKFYILLPLFLGMSLTFAAAVLWPPTYQSTSTILVKEPDVTTDYVNSTITTSPDHKVQVITQRIMTTANLLTIVEDHDLYRMMREEEPIELVIENLRGNIHLEMLNAEVVDPRSGRLSQATIAFKLAFDYGNPEKAQDVLSDLVALYLGENQRTRQKRVTETKVFLDREYDKYQNLLNNQEDRIAKFKRESAGKLPEQIALKIQMRDRAERDLLEYRRQLQSLKEQQIFLQAELSQVSKSAPVRPTGEVSNPADMLRVLQLQYSSLRGRYSGEHPDVIRVAQEIQELRARVGGNVDRAILESERNTLISELVSLKQRYSDSHPDVIKLNNQIKTLETDLSKIPAAKVAVDNPTYIQLQARLKAVQSEMRSYRDQSKTLEETISDIEKDLLEAPEIERKYNRLVREYDGALTSIKNISEQRTQAELSETLEAQHKTEQFLLLESPTVPVAPISPNRLAILVLGAIVSSMFAGGLTLLAEIMDDSVYESSQLATITNTTPLVVIPHIKTRYDLSRLWLARASYVLPVVAACILAFSLTEVFLPTLWPGFSESMGISGPGSSPN